MITPPVHTRLVLADDHDLVRSGIRALLERIAGVEVIAETTNGHELIDLVLKLKPDVTFTDISMPGLDGIECIQRIRQVQPDSRILVLSMYDTIDVIRRAVAAGANGYLMKTAPQFELEQALRSVLTRGSYFSPVISQRLLQRSELSVGDRLTARQIEILTLLAQGKSSKEIAFELGLSSKTVDVHRARIMERLGLKDIASLTRFAVRSGLITP